MGRKNEITQEQLSDAERLRAIFNSNSTVSQREFGEKYRIGSQTLVWQYLNGKKALTRQIAERFAEGLGVSVSDFSPALFEESAKKSRNNNAEGTVLVSFRVDHASKAKMQQLVGIRNLRNPGANVKMGDLWMEAVAEYIARHWEKENRQD